MDRTCRKYDVEGRVTKEKSQKSGKLDGAHRTFYTKEKLEKERFYKEGMKNGKDVYYEFDGTLRREHNTNSCLMKNDIPFLCTSSAQVGLKTDRCYVYRTSKI